MLKIQTPQWLDNALELVESNQFISWAGFIFALGGGGWKALAGAKWVGVSLLFLALVIGSLIAWGLKRRKCPVRCVLCEEEYVLNGARGSQATSKTKARFVFKKYTEEFTFGIKKSAGHIDNERYFYKYLGRHCKDWNAAQREFTDGHTSESTRVVEGNHVYIRLPVPAQINDYYEIVRTYSITNSFPELNEEAGKFILYPCKVLKIKIIFRDCEPTNMLGYASKDFVPIPGTQKPLDLHPDGEGGNMVEWDIENAEPGQRYTVQWAWK